MEEDALPFMRRGVTDNCGGALVAFLSFCFSKPLQLNPAVCNLGTVFALIAWLLRIASFRARKL
jgi:hypothetical protein